MSRLSDIRSDSPTAQQWNQMLDAARQNVITFGNIRGAGVSVPDHPWKVSADQIEDDPRMWRIDVSPSAVNDTPFYIPYKVAGDPRSRATPLIPKAQGDVVVDVPCIDPEPPYLLIKTPPYVTGDATLFKEVPDGQRPPYFASVYPNHKLFRTAIQLSASTSKSLVPFFINATPPKLMGFRVFAGQYNAVTLAPARAGAFVLIAYLWLVRPKGALDAQVGEGGDSGDGDEMFIDQRLFYPVAASITPPPGEYNLPYGSGIVLALGGALALGAGAAAPIALGADIVAASLIEMANAYLNDAFEKAEKVAIWTQ